MSGNLVPLTVIKGAGHEFIPLPRGENATTADFHSIRTKTGSPAHITSGFYKIEAGPQRPAHYNFEETKYVLSGQIDVLVSLPLSNGKLLLQSYDVYILIILDNIDDHGFIDRTRLPESPIT